MGNSQAIAFDTLTTALWPQIILFTNRKQHSKNSMVLFVMTGTWINGRSHSQSHIQISHISNMVSSVLRKIIKTVTNRCQIWRLKCNHIDFGWDWAQTPLAKPTSLVQIPSRIKRILLLRKGERDVEERRGEGKCDVMGNGGAALRQSQVECTHQTATTRHHRSRPMALCDKIGSTWPWLTSHSNKLGWMQ